MTRYFYTDHIASLWMEKRHGMKFVDKRGNPIFQNGAHIDGTYKIYIHPDSLHLLEPVVGDLVYADVAANNGYFTYKPEKEPVVDKIIQRNGTAFHWPESEG